MSEPASRSPARRIRRLLAGGILDAFTALAVVVLVAIGGSRCGPSEARRSYDEYVDVVEPMVEDEREVWARLTKLLRGRLDDPALPAYFEFLETEAKPFYTEYLARLATVEPTGDHVRTAHEHLVRAAEAAYEFVTIESSGRALAQEVRDSALSEFDRRKVDAEASKGEYLRAIGTDPPDPVHTALAQRLADFDRAWAEPFSKGAKPAEEVVAHIRRDVLPAIEVWRREPMEHRKEHRLLLAELSAWKAYFETLAATAPTLARLGRHSGRSEAASVDAAEQKRAFQEALQDARASF